MRRQRSKERKRAAILQAAAALFSEKDFHLVLMDDVAARARVGKGTLYRYFPNKEDLYFATVLDAWDRVRAELEAAFRDDAPPAENLERMTTRVLAFFWPRRYFVALLRDSMENPEWRRRRELVITLVERELMREDKGAVLTSGDMRLVVELFVGMFRTALLYRDNRSKPEELARLIVKLFLDGLRGSITSTPARESGTALARAAAPAAQEPADD